MVSGGGDLCQSSSSGIIFQSDGQSSMQVSSISGPGTVLGPSSADMNRGVRNGTANSSGPSIGGSSLVTDANSALSGRPKLQRSASINTESYVRLPSSPMSFSSNNVSGSSIADGSCIVQQKLHREQVQMQKQGTSSVASQLMTQDPGSLMYAQKRARIDLRQGDMLQQHVLQQLLQRQDSMSFQAHANPQLEAFIQQQKLAQQRQQQQILQSLPPMQRAQMQQQQQLRQQLQHAMQPAYPVKRPIDSGICARRLMQYMYHQRLGRPENSILYWRKFVAEYFASRARKKWCLSMYDSDSNNALGVFPRASMDAWHCEVCGSKSGKGFEAASDVLPRLKQINFDSGVIDELLFLDGPSEFRLPSGLMVLEYVKASQETVYEQLRVIHKGHLRIVFTAELKILSWEFCIRHHEEFYSRRSLGPQVSQLLQAADKYQNAVNERGSSGLSPEDLQSSCNMFAEAGRQITKNLDLQSLNGLGLSKRYVRCLQISEVVNSMKDLIDFSQEHNMGPLESMKSYQNEVAVKIKKRKLQDREQLVNVQGLPAGDPNMIAKLLTDNPGISSNVSNNYTGTRILSSRPGAVPLNNYQSLLRKSLGPIPSAMQPDASSSITGPNPAQQVSFQNSVSSLMSKPCVNGLPEFQQQQQQQHNHLQLVQGNQRLQQQALQQLLQGTIANNQGIQQSLITTSRITAEAIAGSGNFQGAQLSAGSGIGNGMLNIMPIQPPSRNNSFKSAPSNPAASSNSYSSRHELDAAHFHDLDQDVTQELTESGMFSGDW